MLDYKYYHIKFKTLNMGGPNRIFEGNFKSVLDVEEVKEYIFKIYLVTEIEVEEIEKTVDADDLSRYYLQYAVKGYEPFDMA